jgi:hypothetical protein
MTIKTLFSLSVATVCLSITGCATCNTPTHHALESSAYIELIRISADVDGSDRFIFTPRSIRHEHKEWSNPTNVQFNGEPWSNLTRSPPGWRNLNHNLDLSRAMIVQRKGRDVIALEHTAKGFDLYLSDSPNGSAHYEVTIAVPRRR